jgi:hypothetical protein
MPSSERTRSARIPNVKFKFERPRPPAADSLGSAFTAPADLTFLESGLPQSIFVCVMCATQKCNRVFVIAVDLASGHITEHNSERGGTWIVERSPDLPTKTACGQLSPCPTLLVARR